MVRRRMKKTVVFSIFQGILLNQVHCEGCEQTFVKRDAFLDLSLSIPDRFVNQRNKVLQSQNPCTLEDCLESFIETETLEDADMYDCSKCRGKRRATKKLTVDRLPPVCFFSNINFLSKTLTFNSGPLSAFEEIQVYASHANQD